MPRSVLRGTPIYVTGEGEKFALVPEVRRTRKRLRLGPTTFFVAALEPVAVHVIGRDGVIRLRLEARAKPTLKLLALAALLSPALSWLVRRERKDA
ncbi:MAG: hypothetical protein M3328_04750 [Chloroflexota bacterium]|nr:hypothetical protein [Chloroflexota bacterium]